MKHAVSLETFIAGQPLPVDVAQINRQLHELWQMVAGAPTASAAQGITRAGLFNFVVMCDNADAYQRVTRLLGKLTAAYPARAIVVLAQPAAAPAALTATISAHCHAAEGGRRQICCEQITLQANGTRVEQVPTAVLPLLESDLPVLLWWCGNFLQQPALFSRLVAVADRLVFDTSRWTDPWEALPALRETLTRHSHCRSADLSWTRLAFWQDLIAEFFDDPLAVQELNRLTALEIVHDANRATAWRADLLGAWLAVRLGWSPQAFTERLIHRTESLPEGGSSSGFLRLTLRSGTAEFTITKDPREQTVTTTMTTPTVCGIPRRRALWPSDEVTLLSYELDRPQRQDLYQAALTMLSG